MLVTSSQSSTQRPLGLSVEELFALDRQYRRIEQQQQHLAQLQNQARLTSSNLNRLTSRSLDLISSNHPTPLTTLPSLEVHGHGYSNRSHLVPTPIIPNYTRSHSIDHLRYTQPMLSPVPPPPPSSSIMKSNHHQRSSINDSMYPNYQSKYNTYLQQSPMANINATSALGTNLMYGIPSTKSEPYDARASCKLRRQNPVKREPSRRIVVRPVVHRRREPSIGSSCESLDELCSSIHRLPIEQSNISNNQSVTFTPSASLITDVINSLDTETNQLLHRSSTPDSLSDDGEVNLYEMRVLIGKTYDTSDISVQLEGPKILIHCHTIEPTDKRGNYRKHEFKTELLVPDVVDDETIIAYLTEDGQLIVEGKYQPWAWKEIRRKRKFEQQEMKNSSQTSTTSSTATTNDGVIESTKISPLLKFNFIENLDNNRTLIHVGEQLSTPDTKSVSDIINQFNTFQSTTIYDGQYKFTNDQPTILIYYLRLPYEALTNDVRIQSDPELNLLKIFIEQQERNTIETHEQDKKIIIRSTSRICRLPRDHTYDFTRLRVIFLKDNFIRIELPTLR